MFHENRLKRFAGSC